MKNIFFLVSCLLILSGNAVAETRYVSDTLEITMRSGKGTSFGITRMLRSGTAVQVLAVDKNTGYTQVRTKNGKEGWVLSRFLMNGQAARERLTAGDVPAPFQGAAIGLVTAGLMSLAFMGFAGLVKG